MKLKSTFLALTLGLTVNAQHNTVQQQPRWVATWSASPAPPMATEAEMRAAKLLFQNQTLRMFAHTSIGGGKVRVRLSNVFGKESLRIDEAHVALRDKSPNITKNTDSVLTFSGRKTISIPPNAIVISDPVTMKVPADGDLAISIYLEKPTAATGIHYAANATSFVGEGNQAGAASFIQSTTVASWAFLSGIDVAAPAAASTIVAFGDSITDGSRSTQDANRRWPNILAQRLQKAGITNLAVIDAGIGGNRILHDPAMPANMRFGVNALARFDRDVLAQPGVKYVIILEGINDIGHPGSQSAPPSEAVTAEDVIAGLKQLAGRAHEMGLKVIGATLTPFAGCPFPGYYTAEKDAVRAAVNQWVRTTDVYDGYIDFDKATRDPANPDQMLAAYDGGDHLHPGDAGYKAMAEAIDLKMFRAAKKSSKK